MWWKMLFWCQGSKVIVGRLIRDHGKATGGQITSGCNQDLQSSISGKTTPGPFIRYLTLETCSGWPAHNINHAQLLWFHLLPAGATRSDPLYLQELQLSPWTLPRRQEIWRKYEGHTSHMMPQSGRSVGSRNNKTCALSQVAGWKAKFWEVNDWWVKVGEVHPGRGAFDDQRCSSWLTWRLKLRLRANAVI